MEALKQSPKTRAPKTAPANSPQERRQELFAWIGIGILFILSALSFYIVWAKINRGV